MGGIITDEQVERIKLTPLRRIIRDRMTESARIPQFSLEVEVDLERMLNVRARWPDPPSLTACLLWSCSRALGEKTELNGLFYGEEIGRPRTVNIGVAMAKKDGLIVPVVTGAETKTLPVLAEELASLAERARTNRISPDELRGGTFTLSNLGMYGVKSFTPLVNPPQIAIMGTGCLCQGWRMNGDRLESFRYVDVTVTADHRAVDGAVVAEFLQVFKRYAEIDFVKKAFAM